MVRNSHVEPYNNEHLGWQLVSNRGESVPSMSQQFYYETDKDEEAYPTGWLVVEVCLQGRLLSIKHG